MCLLEAGACGVPAVSFDIQTGPADIIQDGVTGYLIPPFEWETMAEKLLELMKDDARLAQMAKQAPEGVKPFLLTNIMEKWMNLMERLLE